MGNTCILKIRFDTICIDAIIIHYCTSIYVCMCVLTEPIQSTVQPTVGTDNQARINDERKATSPNGMTCIESLSSPYIALRSQPKFYLYTCSLTCYNLYLTISVLLWTFSK